ncbi:putative N-acetyltransferase YhbS [Sphingomonas sp. UYAg733]
MTTDDIQLRPTLSADLPELHTLIESAYRGERARAGWTHEADLLDSPRTSIANLASIIGDPDELLLVVLDGTTIVGCVQLTRTSPTMAYLGLLTVNPQRQSSGLGKRIIAAAEGEAMRHFGSEVMELSVVSLRPELIAYYERRGYVLTGERRDFPIPLDPPLSLTVLRKSLPGQDRAPSPAPTG